MKNKIAIIGSGAMATAVAKVAFDTGNENITIYGVDEKELSDLSKGLNSKYFPDTIKLPNFKTTSDLEVALNDVDFIILATPSKVMNIVLNQVISKLSNEAIIINVAKGFYPGTKFSLHEGIYQQTSNNKFIKGVVSLIGPSHAEEIVKSAPTIVSVVGNDIDVIKKAQTLFNNRYFRTYIQTDVKGAEVGAAYKNVLAIASGVSSGLGYGINTTAALLTRGLAEMMRFNKLMGGKTETIMGLTGIGDLIVTAMSPLSRNFTFGKNLALKGKAALNTEATVEGITALGIIHEIGAEEKLDLPIVEFLYNVIYNEESIKELVKSL